MNLYGSLRHLTNLAFRQNSQDIQVTPDTGTTYSASRSFSLPPGDASDAIVGAAATQTLTSKTLTAPVIATIVNTGTLTLPTSTDTLVGRATTDTLTNKTISGASNTLSNISLTASVTGVLPIANGGTNSSTALNNNRVIQSSGGAHVEAAAITAARALISDANGIPTHSAVTSTELGYSSGVTSAIQTQLNGKAATALNNLTVSSLASGSLLVGSSSSAVVNLTVGAEGTVLTVVSGTPAWATSSAAKFAVDWPQVSHTVTISNASPGVVTDTAHGLVNGQALFLTTTGTLPTGLSPNVIYYVNNKATNTYELSATYGGSSINTSSAGSGVHTANITSKNAVHSLGTLDVMVQVYDKADGSTIQVDQAFRTDTNDVLLNASEIPSASGWRVLVQT